MTVAAMLRVRPAALKCKWALGHGYDPMFVPDGESRTFAELAPEEKNRISHRAKALEKLVRDLF